MTRLIRMYGSQPCIGTCTSCVLQLYGYAVFSDYRSHILVQFIGGRIHVYIINYKAVLEKLTSHDKINNL